MSQKCVKVPAAPFKGISIPHICTPLSFCLLLALCPAPPSILFKILTRDCLNLHKTTFYVRIFSSFLNPIYPPPPPLLYLYNTPPPLPELFPQAPETKEQRQQLSRRTCQRHKRQEETQVHSARAFIQRRRIQAQRWK